MNTTDQKFKTTAKIFTAVVLGIGVTVLLGWVLGIEQLKSILPGYVAMKVNTALSFIFIAISLLFIQFKFFSRNIRAAIAWTGAGVVISFAFITIAEYAWGINVGIDQFLFKEGTTAIMTSSPGRMALNTATAFLFAGSSIFFLESERKFFAWVSQVLAVTAGFIGLVGFVGYLYGADPLYIGLQFSTAMALHTTIGFMFLSFATLFTSSDAMMNIIAGEDTGSILFRRIFIVAAVLPILLGGFDVWPAAESLFNEGIRTTFASVFNVSFITVYLLILAHYTNSGEKRRRIVEKKLEDSESLLRKSQVAAHIGSYVADFANDTWRSSEVLDEIFGISKEYERTIEGWANIIHPGDREMMINYFNNEVLGKHTNFDKQYRIIRQNDKAERWVHGLGNIETNADGKVVKMIGTIQDITERKKEEDALKEKYAEMDKLNQLMVGRELRMAELKKERDELAARLENR